MKAKVSMNVELSEEEIKKAICLSIRWKFPIDTIDEPVVSLFYTKEDGYSARLTVDAEKDYDS